MAIDIVAAMRVFGAVVDTGSFAAASERLDLSRGMATRYVAQLEAHLGVRLLHRTTRKLSLTESGRAYYPRAAQVLAMVDEAETSVVRESALPRGTLRVTTSVVFGVGHLDKAISDFLQRHPGLEIELVLNDRVVDLVEEGLDLAVRFSKQIAPALVARRLAGARIVPCAAPRYLKKHGTPRSPEALKDHNCIIQPYSSSHGHWRLRRGGEERIVRVSSNLRSNSGLVLVNAAIEGLGVILEPTFLVCEALRQGKLVRILPGWEGDEFNLFAVYANRRFVPAKVRSFIDFLAERFRSDPYWEG